MIDFKKVMGTFLWLVLTATAVGETLTTVAETSGWTKTGRYQEVLDLCKAYEQAFPKTAKCVTFGTTPERRPMVALLAAGDGNFNPDETHRRGKPVIYFQGAIHAGEIDGKDAGFFVLREILQKRSKEILSKVTLVFVPVFNIDGHERFGKWNRPNQVGPEEMGWRTSAQNLNFNRDYAKVAAPEMQALLKFLNRWDPILHIDLHVTDGAEFQHDVSVLIEPSQAGPDALAALGKKASEELMTTLTAKKHLPLPFYPSFEESDSPDSGITAFPTKARFSQGYWQLRNRFGVLVETHSWKTYAERVRATIDVLNGLIDQGVRDGAKWLEAARWAEAEALNAGGKIVPLEYHVSDRKRTFEFQGYAYTKTHSPISGAERMRYDKTKPQVWKIPLMDDVKVLLAVDAPKGGYVVTPGVADFVRAKLETHGITFRTLGKKESMPVEVFRAETVRKEAQSFEGLQMTKVTGKWSIETREIPNGSLFVPIAQSKGRLVMTLFEPLASDSFVSWGYFNAVFEKKEYMENYVAEAVAEEMLKEPLVKKAFEKKLEDPEFAKDPARRLEFFHRLHSSWDERFNLVPIFRTAAELK